MKNKLLKTILLLISVSSMLLGSSLTVHAEEMQEIIITEQTISPRKQSSGYVYISARVPQGWGGEIRVCFHSLVSGKTHCCSISYIENEYHSGLWLPAGTYQVTAELPWEDGLCRVELEDSSQARLRIQAGEDLYLNLLAAEIPEAEVPTKETEAPVIPPKNQQDYQDLPTQATESETVPATISPNEDLQIIQQEKSPEWLKGLAVTLVLILFIAVIAYTVHEYRQMRDS